MVANASEAPLRELTMAVPQEWIALAGVGVGFLGSLLNQWMATGGQRKIKREEEEARRQYIRDDFQRETLMKVQVLSASLVAHTVNLMGARNRAVAESRTTDPRKFLEACEQLNDQTWKISNRLAILRQRVRDDQFVDASDNDLKFWTRCSSNDPFHFFLWYTRLGPSAMGSAFFVEACSCVALRLPREEDVVSCKCPR
jgi:hypothetical protein